MGSTTIEAPEERDLGEEIEEINEANTKYAPEQYALEKEYMPKYADLNREILYNQMFGNATGEKFLESIDSTQDRGHLAGLQAGYQEALAKEGQGAADAWLERAVANTGDESLIAAYQNRSGNGILDMGIQAVDKIAQQNRESNTAQREADLADAQRMGGEYQDMIKERNSELYGLLDESDAQGLQQDGPSQGERMLAESLGTGRSAVDGVQTGARDVRRMAAPGNVAANTDVTMVDQPADSQVLSKAQMTALADLSLGGQLDPVAAREIEQQILSQYNAMGRSMDNRATSAIASELAKAGEELKSKRFDRALSVESATQGQNAQKLTAQQSNQAADMAGNELDLQGQLANQRTQLETNQANLSADQANQNKDLAVVNQNLAKAGQQDGFTQQYRSGLVDLAKLEEGRDAKEFAELAQSINNRMATQFDPTQGVLGRNSVNQTSYGQASAQGSGMNSGPSGALNVWNSYAGDLNSQNFAEANSNAREQASINADMTAGAIGAVGGMAGGMI
jgi:hypothetical protein